MDLVVFFLYFMGAENKDIMFHVCLWTYIPFCMYVKNFVKFGTNVHYDSWMNWLEFGGQKSEVKLTVT